MKEQNLSDDLHVTNQTNDPFAIVFSQQLKKYRIFESIIKNIVNKSAFALSDIFILNDGVVVKFTSDHATSYENAKIIVVIGTLSVKALFENLDQVRAVQTLYIADVDTEIEFPPQIKKFKQLETLILQNNTFKDLHATIRNLTHLKALDIDNCYYLKQFPQEIEELQELRHLEIKNCQGFETLPAEIAQFKKLICIHLNNLSQLKSLFEIENGLLQALRTIEIEHCHELKVLPDHFDLLPQLEYCEIQNCTQIVLKNDQFKRLYTLENIRLERCNHIHNLPLPYYIATHLTLGINNCPNISIEKLNINKKLNLVLNIQLQMNYREFCDSGHAFNVWFLSHQPQIALNTFVLELNGKRQHVKQFHPKLFELCNLTHLVLNDFNTLMDVPAGLILLTKLQSLVMNKWANLHTISMCIFKLKQLKELRIIRSYKLKNLPAQLGQLSALEVLDLSGCKQLENLPETIGQLRNLKVLRLARCEKLECLPTSVNTLIQLECLHLSGTHFSLLPDFTLFNNLVTLHLSGCELNELPESMKHLSQLQVLHLSGNHQLKVLPLFLLELPKPQVIYISGCTALENLGKFEKHNKQIQIIRRAMI